MRIAVLGTGTMGAPMARHLAAAGHDVTVWNRSPDKAEGIEGTRVADDPTRAARDAEVLVTMLADGPVTLDIVTADVLGALARGAAWWQSATVGVDETTQLHTRAQEAGVAYADAPVLGTKGPAEQGELTVLAGGDAATLDRLEQDVFGPCAARVVRLGAVGDGTRLKLVANHWITALVASIADTVRFAQALGVDPDAWLDAIAGGPLDVGYAKVKGRAMAQGDFTPSFALDLAAKDVGLVLDAAGRHDLSLALAPVVLEQLRVASAAGHGADDLAAIVTASSR